MKNTQELDLQYYINLAKSKVGYKGELNFQTFSKCDEFAGEFEVLSFKESNEPQFLYPAEWVQKKKHIEDCPNAAELGYFTIKLKNTKIYKNREFTCKVQAYVQNDEGLTDRLYISNEPIELKKRMRCYSFPILNWES